MLSLPGPFGAAGFHPDATSTAGLLRPFRSRRLCRAVACAPCIPAIRRPGCKAQRRFARRALRRCGGSLLISGSGAVSRLSPCRRGLIPPQPATPVQGEVNSPQNFLPENPGKKFCVLPRTVASGRGSDAPCGEGSQTGDGSTRGHRTAGPRKTSKPRLPKLNG